MITYLTRRLLLLIPVFVAVSVVIFLILHLIPGDPLDNLLRVGSSPEKRAEMSARYGLDRPLVVADDRIRTDLLHAGHERLRLGLAGSPRA